MCLHNNDYFQLRILSNNSDKNCMTFLPLLTGNCILGINWVISQILMTHAWLLERAWTQTCFSFRLMALLFTQFPELETWESRWTPALSLQHFMGYWALWSLPLSFLAPISSSLLPPFLPQLRLLPSLRLTKCDLCTPEAPYRYFYSQYFLHCCEIIPYNDNNI